MFVKKTRLLRITLVAGTFILSGLPNYAADTPATAIDWSNAGILKWSRGDLRGAISDYSRAISVDPSYQLAYSNRAIAEEALGDLNNALTDYSKAISLNPHDPNLFFARGLTFHLRGDDGEAVNDFKQVVIFNPDGSSDICHFAKGFVNLTREAYRQAIDEFDQAISLDQHRVPRRTASYFHERAVAKAKLGEDLSAKADLEQESHWLKASTQTVH